MLRLGIVKAAKAPTKEFPYGHLREKFIFRCDSPFHMQLDRHRTVALSVLIWRMLADVPGSKPSCSASHSLGAEATLRRDTFQRCVCYAA